MKKISEGEVTSSMNIKIDDFINPEQNQTRCKICFQSTMPLVTLCECTGSIAYVHEDCILDWIALKMEKSQLIQIPNCQICRGTFSATMKIGSKKIDNQLLFEKLKKGTRKEWFIFSGSFIGFVAAMITVIVAVFSILLGQTLIFTSAWSIIITLLRTVFVDFLFPGIYIDTCVKYFKKKWKVIEDCKVQLVEVTLQPKKILKA